MSISPVTEHDFSQTVPRDADVEVRTQRPIAVVRRDLVISGIRLQDYLGR